MEIPSTELQNLIFLIGGAVIGYAIRREKRLLAVEESLKSLEKDIDGIGLILKTPRALAKQLKTLKKEI